MSHRVRPELAIGPARGRTRWAGPMVNSAKSTVGSPPEGPDGFRVMLTPSYGPCGGGWGRRRKRLILLALRSEEHTSELQSHLNLVCRLLLEKKKTTEPGQLHTVHECSH